MFSNQKTIIMIIITRKFILCKAKDTVEWKWIEYFVVLFKTILIVIIPGRNNNIKIYTQYSSVETKLWKKIGKWSSSSSSIITIWSWWSFYHFTYIKIMVKQRMNEKTPLTCENFQFVCRGCYWLLSIDCNLQQCSVSFDDFSILHWLLL